MILVVAALYGLLAKLVLSQFSETGNVTLVWFSGGMGLAVLLLKGVRYWPGIFLGAFAAGLMVDDDFWLSFWIATGNTLESVTAACLLNKNSRFSIALTQPRHFIWLTITAALCSLISAIVGPWAIWWAGFIPTANMPAAVLHWWMADVFGIVFTSPVLLVWRCRPDDWFNKTRIFESLAFIGLTVLAGSIVFLDAFHQWVGHVSRGYWMFAFVVWGAIRFGRQGALLVSTVTAVMALLGAAHHLGFFATDFQVTGMLNFWFYMAVLSWIGNFMALTISNNLEITRGLRDSESRLQAIIDASPVPYAIYDDHGRITLLNPAFVKTFAYTLDDIPTLNDWWPKAYPDPDYRRKVIEKWQPLVERTSLNQSFETMEANICCKNGDVRTVVAGDVTLSESLLGSHLVIMLDVTEQRISNQALAESNQLLHSILETLPIRVFWKDLDSRYLGCNSLFAQDAGEHCPADLLGKNDFQLGWREQAARYRADDLTVMSSGESRMAYEEPQTTPSGDLIWLQTSKLPLRNARQQIIGVLGVYLDITQRKQAEQRLAESLSLLRATFEATADGILVVNMDSKITAFNQRFLELWRLSEQQIKDAEYKSLVAAVLDQLVDPERFMQRIDELQAQPDIESFDLLALKDGNVLERYSRPQQIDGKVAGRVLSFRDITLRKRMEEQLLWRTTFLESLLESSPDGIIAVDDNGKKLLQNRRTAELWGIPADVFNDPDDAKQVEFVQKQTKDPQKFVEKVTYLYSHPELTSYDEIELRNGAILQRYTSPVRDRLGKYYGRIWSFRDITEMRNAEKALQQKEYYQRALIDNFPFIVWLKDADSRYLATNRVFAETFATGIDAVIGKDDFAIFPEDLAEKYRADDQQVMISRQRKNIEEVVLEQGVNKWVETYKAPLIDEQGNLLGTVGFARDITYRKQAEQKLQLAALVYQNSSEAMVVTDADNKIITINPAFTQITGYSAEDVVGKNPRILASGLHDKNFYRAMWHDLNATGSWRGEIKNRHKSGELYIEELTINTIYDSKDQPQQRVALFSDITKRKQSEEQIWQQANFDPLTGLPNRRMFRDRLDQEIKKAHRVQQNFALLFIDLDRFKEVNDTLGHEMGDRLLKEAANRLTACVRASDTVARLGGDEFTIILSELDSIDSPDRVVKSLLQQLSMPFHIDAELVYVSASIGITLYPNDGSELSQLLKNADQAMYAAKNQGRNCYRFFTQSMQETLQLRASMLNDLRIALADQQFKLCYQPIVELSSGAVHKAEALLRWQHPQRGLVSPGEFISLAEESGLINGIGDWVFNTAVSQLVEWRKSLHADFQLSINMSPVQIQNPEHSSRLWSDYLRKLGLPGSSVVMEITEGLLLEANKLVSERLLVFRDVGIQVAIDDFGTGYSALSYLKKFDIDFLKIDQSFVRNLSKGSSDFVLCEAIIVMAHKLGLKVIAEGVETEQQRDLLTEIGCDYAQGYLYAKPLFAGAFAQQFGGAV